MALGTSWFVEALWSAAARRSFCFRQRDIRVETEAPSSERKAASSRSTPEADNFMTVRRQAADKFFAATLRRAFQLVTFSPNKSVRLAGVVIT
jgi:hypothetical protein